MTERAEATIAKIKALRKSGKSYQEIAKAIKLSPQRVGWYVRTFVENRKPKKRVVTKTTKKSVAKKTTAKKTVAKKKTETRGAREARKAQEAFATAHGLTKKSDSKIATPLPKSHSARKPKPIADKIPAPSLAESAAAVQG